MTSHPAGRRPSGWRALSRRRGLLVAAAAGVVVAGSVAVDVGGSTTAANRASDLRGYVTLINTDMASCNSSLRDSLSAYTTVVGGRPDERNTAISIIRGDEPNCTAVSNTDLYDLATTEAPASLRPWNVQSVTTAVTTWAYPNATTAMTDLGNLLVNPGDQASRQSLRASSKALLRLETSAQRTLDVAAGALGTHVKVLDLGATSGLGAAGF